MRKHYPLNSNGAEDAAQLPWKDGVPQTGVEGSYPGQALFTDTEAEILAAIAASGQALSGADLTQLIQAIGRGIYLGQFAGTANQLSAAVPSSIVFATLLRGMRFTGYVTAANTAGVTLSLTCLSGVNAIVQAPLLTKNGAALKAADLPTNQDFEFRWDGSAFRMVGSVASETVSTASVNDTVSTAVAGLKAPPFKKYEAGTYQVPVPAGATGCRSKLWGAGGSSGGVGSTNNGSGSGGGGGGFSFKTITGLTPGQQITLVIGAGAPAGGVGGSGQTGGTTTLGAYHSATGGGPGSANGPGTGGPGGSGVGGDVNLTGGYGSAGAAGGAGTGGQGGGAPLGGQGGGGAPGIAAPGTSPGGGGGGPGSTTINPGAAGADGGAELEWF